MDLFNQPTEEWLEENPYRKQQLEEVMQWLDPVNEIDNEVNQEGRGNSQLVEVIAGLDDVNDDGVNEQINEMDNEEGPSNSMPRVRIVSRKERHIWHFNTTGIEFVLRVDDDNLSVNDLHTVFDELVNWVVDGFLPDGRVGIQLTVDGLRMDVFVPFTRVDQLTVQRLLDLIEKMVENRNKNIMVVDGRNEKKSNWLRYVNYACCKKEQNLIAVQSQPGGIYYMTCKVIAAQTQLLVWYNTTNQMIADINGHNKSFAGSTSEVNKPETINIKCSENKQEEAKIGRCQRGEPLNSQKCAVDMRGANCTFLQMEQKQTMFSNLHDVDGENCGVAIEEKYVAGKIIKQVTYNNENATGTSSLQLNEKYEYRLCEDKFLRYERSLLNLTSHIDRTPNECNADVKICGEDIELSLQKTNNHPSEKLSGFKTCRKKLKDDELKWDESKTADEGHNVKFQQNDKTYMGNERGESCEKGNTLNSSNSFQSINPNYENYREEGNFKQQMPLMQTGEKPCKLNACKKYGNNFLNMKETICFSEKPHECNVCKMKFICKFAFTLHKCTHANEKLHECNFCGKRFSLLKYLKRHKVHHTGENPYECNLCKKKFYSKSSLKLHERIHTGEKPYECNICKKKFYYQCNLKSHEISRMHIGEKPYECNVCKEKFSCKFEFKLHKSIHINEKQQQKRIHNNEKRHECNLCGKRFSALQYLKKHKITHTSEKPYECSECKKKFKYKFTFKLHKSTHTNEKPHECNLCGKRFSVLQYLKNHKMTHAVEKSYECSECKKKFTRRKGLMLHHRIHTGEKPFKCDVCAKEFRTSNGLRQHKVIHSGVKAYECKECGKKFAIKEYLVLHESIHTGIKRYECKECGKKFARKYYLTKHEWLHTGMKPYKCSMCEKTFSQKIYLKSHESMHTRLTNLSNVT